MESLQRPRTVTRLTLAGTYKKYKGIFRQIRMQIQGQVQVQIQIIQQNSPHRGYKIQPRIPRR